MLYLITSTMYNQPIALVSGNSKNDKHDIMIKMFKQFGFTRSAEYIYSIPGRLHKNSNTILRAEECGVYHLVKQLDAWFGEWGNHFYLIFKDVDPEYNVLNMEEFVCGLSVFPKSKDVKRCVAFKFSDNYWKQRFLWTCSDWKEL